MGKEKKMFSLHDKLFSPCDEPVCRDRDIGFNEGLKAAQNLISAWIRETENEEALDILQNIHGEDIETDEIFGIENNWDSEEE